MGEQGGRGGTVVEDGVDRCAGGHLVFSGRRPSVCPGTSLFELAGKTQ